jgi:hypothetical protein
VRTFLGIATLLFFGTLCKAQDPLSVWTQSIIRLSLRTPRFGWCACFSSLSTGLS